jgi:DNA-directed RNA polymerase I, II, and III subunit RPABC2
MSDNEDNEDNYYSDHDTDSDEESTKFKSVGKKNIPIKIKPLKGGSVDEFSDEEDDDDGDMDIIDKSMNELEEANVAINDEDNDMDFINNDNDDEDIDEEDIDDENNLNVPDNDGSKKDVSSNINNLSVLPNATSVINDNDDTDYNDNEDDDSSDNYLQKFNSELTKNYIDSFHPECLSANLDEVEKLSRVIRDKNNIIIDPLHKTVPFLTKYEKARIIGQRCAQLDNGAIPFVKVPEDIIESYIIADMELQEKKIPFIIKRPIPNGGFEYWNVKDLEILTY